MYIIFLFLWMFSLLFFISEYKTERTFFVALSFFFYGCGGVAVFFFHIKGDSLLLSLLMTICLSFMYFWGPCTTFLYVVFANKRLQQMKVIYKTLFVFLSCIPAFSSYFMFSSLMNFSPFWLAMDEKYIHSIFLISLFTGPYFVLAIVLSLVSWFRETNLKEREEKKHAAIILIPSIIMSITINFVLPMTTRINTWKLNVFTILVVSGLFMTMAVFRSAFGLKIYHENVSKEQSQKVVIQSTRVLHHTMKNAMLSIRLSLQNAKYRNATSVQKDKKIETDIVHAQASCEHVLDVFDRIEMKFKPLQIKEEEASIVEIVEKAIQQLIASQTEKIIFKKEYQFVRNLYCDPVHLCEVFFNLMSNSVDAIDQKPAKIKISITNKRKNMIIRISDNGIGLTKEELKEVGTPLYTRKKGKNHFGLGLFYVERVIQAHNGKFCIKNNEKQGATAEIIFPHTRIINPEKYSEL